MFKKRSSEWIRHLDFEILDLLCLTITMILVVFIRNGEYDFSNFENTSLIFGLVLYDIITIFILHPYKNVVQRGFWKEAVSLVKHYGMIYVLMIMSFYLMHSSDLLPRLTIGLSFVISLVISWMAHCLLKHLIHQYLRNNLNKRRMVLLTDAAHLADTYAGITDKKFNPFDVTAIILLSGKDQVSSGNGLDDSQVDLQKLQQTNSKWKDIPFIVGLRDGKQYILQEVVDEVFVDRFGLDYDWDAIILGFLEMGICVHIGMPSEMMHYPNSLISHVGDRVVVQTMVNSAYSWKLGLKRLADICGALVGLLITGIASIFIIPAIKMADPGPAIFKQKRVGTNGRIFNFYKFRSMYMDAEERKKDLMENNQMQGLMFKMENDPRIIGSEKGPGKGLGNFLRRSSLDELPQFWNILVGDMSLVGTRPPTLGEYEQYEPHHKIRLSMKPGLTGLWQVSGRSDITDFEEVVRLDTAYIENWSIGLDIKILLQTVLVVLGKKGSK